MKRDGCSRKLSCLESLTRPTISYTRSWRRIICKPHRLPDGIRAAEIESCGSLVEDGYLGGGGVVARRERASQQQTHAECLKIFRRNGREMHYFVLVGAWCEPGDVQNRAAVAAAHRAHRGPTGGAHSWYPADAIEDFRLRGQPLGRAERLPLRCDLHGKNAFGIEPEVDRLEPAQGTDEQSRAGQQHRGERHLSDHQGAAEPHGEAASGDAARPALESGAGIETRRPQGRQHAERQTAQYCDGEREQQHVSVQRQVEDNLVSGLRRKTRPGRLRPGVQAKSPRRRPTRPARVPRSRFGE